MVVTHFRCQFRVEPMSSNVLNKMRYLVGTPNSWNQVPTVAGGGNLVINNPGLAPGQPGSQITVPLQSLQALKPGEGIPTGQANHLLVKTENNQYQVSQCQPFGQLKSQVTQISLPLVSKNPKLTN